MTTVQSTTAATAATAPTAATAATPTVGAKTTEKMNQAQDRFLKLLVSQMKNQDPLNPMDNAQVTTQMAQISTVTGIGQLNDTIAGFLGKLTGMESLQGVSLAGHQVLVPGNALQLASGAASGGFELANAADSAKLSVMDAAGRKIYENSLGAQPAGVRGFAWNGLTTTGDKAADGSYTFKIEASSAGTALPATTLAYGRVNGVTPASSGLQLDLGSLGVRAYSDVKQIQ
jgi:flagellar basal-body rod modification protein FlgD